MNKKTLLVVGIIIGLLALVGIVSATTVHFYEARQNSNQNQTVDVDDQLEDNEGTNQSGNQQTNGDIISQQEAEEIALAEVGSGTVVRTELDSDDGRLEYEVKIKTDTYFVEVTVDAATGLVLDVDIDD